MGKVRLGRLVLYLVLTAIVGLLLSMLSDLTSLNYIVRKGFSESAAQEQHRRNVEPTLMIDDTEALAVAHRVGRVLCWVPSTPKQLNVKVKAVNSTWITRCDGHIFFIEDVPAPMPVDVVSLDVPRGYFNLTKKVVGVLQYLYHHHLQDYDWFVKGDDDAYLIMENLRFILAQYDPRDPVYVGHLYKQYHPQGYMSGGASYVLSRQALKQVVEEGYQKNKCATKGRYEDVEIGKCLHATGVASHNSRDIFGRDTFHPLRPSVHIAGPIPANQLPQDRFVMVSGHECCSQLTVSFHKLDPSLMKVFDQLLYRTTVYGRQPNMQALADLVKADTIPPLVKEGG